MKIDGFEVDICTAYKRLTENQDLYECLDATPDEKDALGQLVLLSSFCSRQRLRADAAERERCLYEV